MNKRFLEESVLFVSVVKWSLLSTIVGIIVGAATAVFLRLLDLSTNYASNFKYYFLALPLALFTSTVLVRYLAPEARGHGTEKVIEPYTKGSAK